MGKRTELLRDMLPGLSWVGALLNMSNRSQPPQWTEIQNTARTNGVETQLFDVEVRPIWRLQSMMQASKRLVPSSSV
jgi:ABC-type uncharacterized transport system substrate-binding protein